MKKTKDYEGLLQKRQEYYNFYYNKYYNLFFNRFIINGLDYQQIDYLMRRLWKEGTFWLFTNNVLDVITPIITPYAVQEFNIYDFPVKVIPVNTRGVEFIPSTPQLVDKDGVIVYGQRSKKPIFMLVNHYCLKLAFVEMVIQTNLIAHKTPWIIGTSVEDEKKAEELWELIISDEPKLIWSLSEIDKVKSLLSGAPYILDKLYNYKQSLENELREVLGLDNLGIGEKKEHLVVGEIEQNDEVTGASSDSFLNVLQEGFERANKVLGLNLSVELNKPYEKEVDDETEEEEDLQDEE